MSKNLRRKLRIKEARERFLGHYEDAKKLVLPKKKELKRKKNQRLLQTIHICKEHGGPLTDNNLELVESLSEKQLISEIVFLRLAVAPKIRRQRRVKDTNTGKFVVEKYTAEKLGASIINAIKPEDEVDNTVDGLLLKIFTRTFVFWFSQCNLSALTIY